MIQQLLEMWTFHHFQGHQNYSVTGHACILCANNKHCGLLWPDSDSPLGVAFSLSQYTLASHQ